MDYFHKVCKWVSYNRGVVFGVLIMAVAFTFVSCTPTTISPISGKEVNQQELNYEIIKQSADFGERRAEIEALEAKFNADVDAANEANELAGKDLQAKYERNQKLADTAMSVFNTLPDFQGKGLLVSLLGSGLIGGLTYDNYRKGKKIKGMKNDTNPPATT